MSFDNFLGLFEKAIQFPELVLLGVIKRVIVTLRALHVRAEEES
jgi:hypothetical protein